MSDTETSVVRDYDLEEVLTEAVDDIAAKFEYMTTQHLGMLHDLEELGRNRTTLLAAIDRELAHRRENAVEGEAAVADPVPDVTYSQAEVDALLANQAAAHAAEVEKLKAAAAAPVPKAGGKRKSGKAIVRAKDAEVPALVALTGETRVAFVDTEDYPVALPGLAFGPSDFQPSGEAATLGKEVVFPTDADAMFVAAAWLIDENGKAIGKAALVQPFAVGGGRSAKLPPGALRFR